MRVILTGSRRYDNYEYVSKILDAELKDIKHLEVVVGDATGVDRIVELYCQNKGIYYSKFEADWEEFGLAAGPIRNNDMAKHAKLAPEGCKAIAFPAKDSKGTRDMIYQCKRLRIPCKIYEV